ncbi:MAG: hypothetical protein J6X56_04715 [Ruminococcus sp.]|nr:hypothetical protein [Ruminococcus sp.]
MAIYVKAVKKTETNETVTYSYGDNPDALEGRIEISKADMSWRIVEKSSGKGGDFAAVAVIPKIIRSFEKTGKFPEIVYKES